MWHTMGNEPQDAILPLGRATIVMQLGGERQRFRVNAATLKLLPRRRVRLGFEGPKGSVAIEISRAAFWRFTSQFHERAIAAEPAHQPRPRRKRS